MATLHIGTSGWSYKHWAGIFYPETVKPARYLEYYVTKFDCVELNTSFYHVPVEAAVKGWLDRTPPHFLFCPKLSRYITHQLKLTHFQSSLHRFFEVMQFMKPKMGPVLIQLPPGLSYQKERVVEFLAYLYEHFPDYRFAMEIRHKSWLNDEFFTILEKYHVAFAIAESGVRFPYYETVTTSFVYIRFHGPEALYASGYTDEQLAFYASKISFWMQSGYDVWVYFNNDFNGYALGNAYKLKELTGYSHQLA